MIESGDIFDMYSRTKRTKPKKKEKEKKPVKEQAKHTEITIGDPYKNGSNGIIKYRSRL